MVFNFSKEKGNLQFTPWPLEGVLIIVPFRLDNVLLALYTFTSFAYHFDVFKSFCSGVCIA
jgi:hypothetical protein